MADVYLVLFFLMYRLQVIAIAFFMAASYTAKSQPVINLRLTDTAYIQPLQYSGVIIQKIYRHYEDSTYEQYNISPSHVRLDWGADFSDATFQEPAIFESIDFPRAKFKGAVLSGLHPGNIQGRSGFQQYRLSKASEIHVHGFPGQCKIR
jgi:hypothetical protein